jgi:hypothetical protein
MEHRSTYWCLIHISKNSLKSNNYSYYNSQGSMYKGKALLSVPSCPWTEGGAQSPGQKALTGAFPCITTEALLTLQITLHPHP